MTPEQQRVLAEVRALKAQKLKEATAAPQKTMMGRASAALDAAGQGLLTPFIDEVVDYGIASPIATLATGLPYKYVADLAREETQKKQKTDAELYPVTTGVSTLGGGILGLGMLGGTALGKGIDAISRPIAQKGLLKIAEQGLRGAAIGIPTGAAVGYAQGFGEEDRAKQAKETAAISGVLGGGLGVLGGVGGALKNTFAPVYDDYTAKLAKKAKDIGIKIPVDAGQDKPALKKAIRAAETVPFASTGKIERENLNNWSRAVGKTIGVDAPISTPTLAKAKEQIGARFDAIESGRNIAVSDDLLQGINNLEEFAQTAVTKDIGEQIQLQINKIRANIEGKESIPVETLARLRKDMGKLANKSSNYELSSGYQEIEGFLGDTIIDTLEGATRKDYQDLKNVYRNFLSVKKAVKLDPTGALESPSKFLSSVSTVFRDFPEGGGGEVADLARIGKLFVKQRPEGSPTATNVMGVLGGALPIATFLGGAPATLGVLAPAAAVGGAKAITSQAYNQGLVENAIKKALGETIEQPLGILGTTNKMIMGK